MSTRLPAEFVAALSALLGDGWRSDDAAREAQASDDSHRRGLPDAVAFPRDREQVVAIVRACRAHRVPIVARGAGTGTTGAAVASRGGIAVAFAQMDRILDIRPGDRYAVVEPGLRNGALQQALAPHRLFWPPDPSSADTCSIGGNLATNAGGPRTVKYGATRDNVLGLVAVTGRGELIRCGGPWTKTASGYDLTRLIVGSEGTLALVVEATLKLSPLPQAQAGLRAFYRDAACAAAAVAQLMAQPVVPAMLEFMDHRSIELLRRNGSDVPAAGAMLLVEADGSHDALPDILAALATAARGEGLLDLDVASDGIARDRLWAARRALSPALRSIAPGKLNEDVVVPVSRIPDLIDGVERLSAACGLPIVVFGHAGNGNLHVNLLYHPDHTGEAARAQATLPQLFELALALGGTLSGEHGIGLSKRGYMAAAHDAATLATMHAIKAALDPDGILNPGKLLPDPD